MTGCKFLLVSAAVIRYNCFALPVKGRGIQIYRVGGSRSLSSVALAKEDVATITAAFGWRRFL